MIKTKELLEKLSNAHGISGHEGNIRDIIKDIILPFVDEITMLNRINIF